MKRGTRKPATPAVFKPAKTNPPAANTATSESKTPYDFAAAAADFPPSPEPALSPNPLSPAIHDGPPESDLAPHFSEHPGKHVPGVITTAQAEPSPEPPQAVADYRAVAGLVEPKTPPPVPIEQMSLIQLRGYIQRSGIAAAYPDLMDVYDLAKLRGIVAELMGN